MGSLDPSFMKRGQKLRSAQQELVAKAQAGHPGTLDFSAYAQAHDPRYLGFQGDLFVGRPCGNESSAVLSTMNQAGYWKRYYFDRVREPLPFATATMHHFLQYKPEALNSVLNKGAKNKDGTDATPVDLSGIQNLASGMREQVMVLDRPPRVDSGGRSLSVFHNVLGHKYTAALGKNVELDAQPYEYCKSAHTSTKKELDFVLMHYFRRDNQIMLDRDNTLKRSSSIDKFFPGKDKEQAAPAATLLESEAKPAAEKGTGDNKKKTKASKK